MPGTSTTRLPLLTIRGVRTSAIEVPMKFPLRTSGSTVNSAPLLLIDLETEDGMTGRTYLFCYRPSVPRAIDVVLRDAVSVVKGEPVAPLEHRGPSSPGASRSSGCGKRGPDGALRARRGVVGCTRRRFAYFRPRLVRRGQ
jgi:hypothetical protein